MPRDELAPWQKAAIEPVFESIAEWGAEAIGGALAAASKEHRVNALFKAMLKKVGENPTNLFLLRALSRTSKHALIRFMQTSMPRRIGPFELDEDFVQFMRGVIPTIIDGLGDRFHEELTHERIDQLVNQKVPIPPSPTGAAGPGAPMPDPAHPPATGAVAAAAVAAPAAVIAEMPSRELLAEMISHTAAAAADPLVSERFGEISRQIFTAIGTDVANELPRSRETLEAIVAGLRVNALGMFQILAVCEDEQDAFDLFRVMGLACLKSASTRAKAGDLFDALIRGEDKKAVIAEMRSWARAGFKVVKGVAMGTAILAVVLMLVIVSAGVFGFGGIIVAFVKPYANGTLNLRSFGFGVGSLLVGAIALVLLGVLWDNVKSVVAAAADKADDPIQWLGQVIKETANNLSGRATS